VSSLNTFDVAIYVAAVVAIIGGFSAGLIRSLANIVAYLAAAPIAVAVMPLVAPALAGKLDTPAQSSLLLAGIFLVTGLLLGQLFRVVIDEAFGPSVDVFDRLAGALFGAVRIGLIAMTLVMVFDRIIPVGRQPAFLAGSQLRPLLSAAAQTTLKTLPPEVTAYIDQLKRQRGI
jgi:membrane protein required for colicin V production